MEKGSCEQSVVGESHQKPNPISHRFLSVKGRGNDDHAFNVKLFVARKKAEHTIYESKLSEADYFYLPSLSTHTLIYKVFLFPRILKPITPTSLIRLLLHAWPWCISDFQPTPSLHGIWRNRFATCATTEKSIPTEGTSAECRQEKSYSSQNSLVRTSTKYFLSFLKENRTPPPWTWSWNCFWPLVVRFPRS